MLLCSFHDESRHSPVEEADNFGDRQIQVVWFLSASFGSPICDMSYSLLNIPETCACEDVKELDFECVVC